MPIGIPAALIASAAIGGGASVVGGALANRSRKGTSTQTSKRTLPPELQPLQGDVLARLRARLADPTAGVAPVRVAARANVNRGFGAAMPALRDRLLSSGGGKSGKFGRAVRETELARIGSLAGLEGGFAKLIFDREDSTLSLAERLLAFGQGSETTGEQTFPGNALGGAFASGAESLGSITTLLTLSKLLRGGGGTLPGGVHPGGEG